MDLPARTLIALGPGVAHTAKAHTDCAFFASIRDVAELNARPPFLT